MTGIRTEGTGNANDQAIPFGELLGKVDGVPGRLLREDVQVWDNIADLDEGSAGRVEAARSSHAGPRCESQGAESRPECHGSSYICDRAKELINPVLCRRLADKLHQYVRGSAVTFASLSTKGAFNYPQAPNG